MPPASNYPDYAEVIHRLVEPPDAIGAEKTPYQPSGQFLWCGISEDSGTTQNIADADQTVVTGTIVISDYPDNVQPLDMLYDGTYYWHILTIVNGDQEMICDVVRWDSLRDFVLVEAEGS